MPAFLAFSVRRCERCEDFQVTTIDPLITPASIDIRPDSQGSRVVGIGRVLCVLVPTSVWIAPIGLDPTSQHAVAITAFMILAWITQAMDFTLAGLIGCFLFWALGVANFNLAFSGFANDTAWFLFAALLIGVIATRSGVARRVAYLVMLRTGVTYSRILLGLIVTDFLLTFIVPSGIARIVIVAAIALGLIEAFGAQRGSNIARGMFLVLTYTANIFDKMIIAGAGSITARGLIERFGNVDVLWSLWFLAFLPCSIITVLAAWRLTLWLYPPEQARLEHGYEYLREELRKMGPLSSSEQRAALLMLIAVVLWLTDFLHHIPPALIGMGVALFALLPRVGILDADDLRRLNYMPVFFVAAAVSMGNVLASTKALEILTNVMFAGIQPFMTDVLSTTVVMYWAAFIYHFFLASEISMLGTSLPLVMTFAKEHGMNPLLLGMIWTFAAGGKLFAYQSGALIVGYSYGYFDAKDLLSIGWWLTIVEFVVLLFLVPFYWPLLGIQ
jgi:solute carrier family 13 (sodium-dependent dicarboxylate transporter), member 2/3/5